MFDSYSKNEQQHITIGHGNMFNEKKWKPFFCSFNIYNLITCRWVTDWLALSEHWCLKFTTVKKRRYFAIGKFCVRDDIKSSSKFAIFSYLKFTGTFDVIPKDIFITGKFRSFFPIGKFPVLQYLVKQMKTDCSCLFILKKGIIKIFCSENFADT